MAVAKSCVVFLKILFEKVVHFVNLYFSIP